MVVGDHSLSKFKITTFIAFRRTYKELEFRQNSRKLLKGSEPENVKSNNPPLTIFLRTGFFSFLLRIAKNGIILVRYSAADVMNVFAGI